MSLYKKEHYSFSALEQFEQCPYSFYLSRIENKHSKDNAFAQYGTLMHDIINKWALGEIPTENLPFEWEERYPEEVTEKWPAYLEVKGYADKSYEQGYNYLDSFDSFKDYNIESTEEFFTVDIEGRKFVGVVDMIAYDKNTNELVIIDHKSKSKSAFKSAKKHMYKQLYLYSIYCKEKYGIYPSKLIFNLFKEGTYEIKDFDIEEFEQAKKWCISVIKNIEAFDIIDFLTTKEDKFFCSNLCDAREHCSG